jgi:hypothetical protein
MNGLHTKTVSNFENLSGKVFIIHRSLNNIAPKDVNKDNEADIWAFMYLKPKIIKLKMKNRAAQKYR